MKLSLYSKKCTISGWVHIVNRNEYTFECSTLLYLCTKVHCVVHIDSRVFEEPARSTRITTFERLFFIGDNTLWRRKSERGQQ